MTRYPPLRSALARLGLLASLTSVLAACSQNAVTITHYSPPPSWPAPALVQIEDHPDAHPHAGLQEANIVYEYLTEGAISRFTAIYFHPSGSDRVEPVRSTRLITLRLQRAYHGLIFTSGASDHVLGLLYGGNYPFVMEQSGNGRYFERDPNRLAPHNLYTTMDQLKDGVQRHHMRIYYQLPTGTPAGPSTAATHIAFAQTSSHGVIYVYSKSQAAYEYQWSWNGVFQGPEVDTDNGGRPVMVKNVVIVFVPHLVENYIEDVLGAHGLDFQLQGTGPALVFSGGREYQATWDMRNPKAPLKLLGAKGKPLLLPAGLEWIHLVDPGTAVAVS